MLLEASGGLVTGQNHAAPVRSQGVFEASLIRWEKNEAQRHPRRAPKGDSRQLAGASL